MKIMIIWHKTIEGEEKSEFVKSFRILNRWLRIYKLTAIQDSDTNSILLFNVIDENGIEIGYYTVHED